MPVSAFAVAGTFPTVSTRRGHPCPKLKSWKSVDIDGFCFGVQVLQRAWFNPGAGDKGVNFLFLQPDHSAELVSGQLAFIDEFVQGTKRHPETACRIVGRQPAEV